MEHKVAFIWIKNWITLLDNIFYVTYLWITFLDNLFWIKFTPLFHRYCKSLGEREIEELKTFASKRKKNVLGRGTVFLSDENRSCKEVSVVYFDQGMGASHEVRWMKSSFLVFFSCFSLYFMNDTFSMFVDIN